MPDIESFDPALFGTWPDRPTYGSSSDGGGWSAERSRRAAASTEKMLALETKAAAPPEDELRLLLNDMTREMRDQFDYFRRLRTEAEAREGEGADEAAAKLARADVKAANDAMSLIVRTLEKIDTLQRQLARDRELEAERHEAAPDYQEIRNKILAQIEARANEMALRLYAEWVAGTGPLPSDNLLAGLPQTIPVQGNRHDRRRAEKLDRKAASFLKNTAGKVLESRNGLDSLKAGLRSLGGSIERAGPVDPDDNAPSATTERPLPNPSPQGGGANLPPAPAETLDERQQRLISPLEGVQRTGRDERLDPGPGRAEGGVAGDDIELCPRERASSEQGCPPTALAVATVDGESSLSCPAVVLPPTIDIPGIGAIPVSDGKTLASEWLISGRDDQKPPKGDWRTWLVLGGRGSGKTRAGAEWIHALASAGDRSELRIALVAETLGDAREVMIDGVSGICRIAREKRPEVEISRRRLVWPNGAMAQIFSSEDPESLRGPQFHLAWCDELAKWKHAQETWDMLQFGLRLGAAPRQLVTTTPRPLPLLKALMSDTGTRLVRMATSANTENLAPGFIDALSARYGGTRLGRQELEGELIEDREDGLWKRDGLEAIVIRFSGALRRIVVAVDPPAASGASSCCGIVVAGLEASGRAVVLADCSVEGASPAAWAAAVVRAYRRFDADRIVAEINQGGDMVTAMLRSVDAALPVATVRATRGKFLRAEPVAALYEQGRVAHAGRFTALEDQMCDFGPDGLSSGRSPDRLDALVWALTFLMLEANGEPRVRGI